MSSIWERRLGLVRVAALVAVAALLLVAKLWSPRARPDESVVKVAAAADLRFALDELTSAYRRSTPAVSFQVTYGSSGTLYSQIVNGAPFDLFLSADVDYPRRLAGQGRTVSDTEFTYAIGRLAVWVPNGSPLDVDAAGLQVVADPRVSHVAIANPEHAPYGRAAEAAMRTMHLYDAAKPKLVLGENISQAMQFAQSGAADVGLVALSLAVAPTAKGAGRFSLVPLDAYPRLEQGGVVLRSSAERAAVAFRTYLLGNAARAVLARYGFSTPDA